MQFLCVCACVGFGNKSYYFFFSFCSITVIHAPFLLAGVLATTRGALVERIARAKGGVHAMFPC